VLNVAGSPNPGTEHWVQPDVTTALAHEYGLGYFGIVTYPCLTRRWAFSPTIFNALWPYVRDVDFITLHSLYSFPVLAGYLLARWFRKPYGLWPHGVLAPVQRHISAGKKTVYDWLVARATLNNASVLFYTAPGERAEARSLHLKPPSVIIPHGLDLQAFTNLPPRGAFRSRYLARHSGPLVLFLSRLNAKKGLDMLVRAFAFVVERVPDARLAIVGGGDPPQFAQQVASWVKESNVSDYVVMPGFMTGPQQMQAFADADVFILPSHAENFGFAVFEAMASRLPVVVSDTLNYAQEIESHQAGLSVPRDPHLFADALVRLLTDQELRHKLGQNGFDLARMYSWETTGEKVERTIGSILWGEPLPADLTLEQG
jgi:glycosyltransferase involved in cell wall biosynthesis